MAGDLNSSKAELGTTLGAETAVGKPERPKAQQLRLCLLVLGIEGVGTPALATVLHRLGCGLPKSSSTSGAPATMSSKVRELNEEILASAGSSWDDFTPFPSQWLESPVCREFTKRATAILEEDFSGDPLFVLDDPLISRIVPFWLDVLKRSGCSAKPVLMVRNPIEVGASFAGSNLSEPLGQLLWLRYALDAERFTRGLPRAHVSFEELRTGWETVAEKTGEALELCWPKPIGKVEFDVADDLNLAAPARKDLQARSTTSSLVSNWVREAYKVLNGWALGEEMGAHQRILDQVKAEFDTASLAFSRLVQAERHNSAKQKQLSLEADVEALTAANALSAEEIEKLRAALQEQRRQTTLLNAELYELKAANSDLEVQLKDLRTELVASRERRKEMARVIGRRDAELAERYHDLAALQRRLVRLSPSWNARRMIGGTKKLYRRMFGRGAGSN